MGPVLDSGFISMKWQGVLRLPSGWDASLLQGYPQYICWYPFVHLGEEKHCESKVSCLRTRHNDPSQGSNLDTRSGVECTNHETTAPPHMNKESLTYKHQYIYQFTHHIKSRWMDTPFNDRHTPLPYEQKQSKNKNKYIIECAELSKKSR